MKSSDARTAHKLRIGAKKLRYAGRAARSPPSRPRSPPLLDRLAAVAGDARRAARRRRAHADRREVPGARRCAGAAGRARAVCAARWRTAIEQARGARRRARPAARDLRARNRCATPFVELPLASCRGDSRPRARRRRGRARPRANAARPHGLAHRWRSRRPTECTGGEARADAAGDEPDRASSLCGQPNVVIADTRSADRVRRGARRRRGASAVRRRRQVADDALAHFSHAQTIVVYGNSTDDARPVADSLQRRHPDVQGRGARRRLRRAGRRRGSPARRARATSASRP